VTSLGVRNEDLSFHFSDPLAALMALIASIDGYIVKE